jgi:glycosyltransferase involved in cell wall biosynthesis
VPIPESSIYQWQQEGRLVYEPDEFIVCSEAYRKLIRDLFMTERSINMIYNGIRTDEWNSGAGNSFRAKHRHGLYERPIALFVGRIAEQKGIVPILDAVEDHDNGYQVVLSGEVNAATATARDEWSVTKRIKKLCEAYPERIKWVGFNHGQDLFDLYSAAAVALMPSLHEPFGIAALEAMAMGAPLIATESDGLGEIVRDREQEYALIIEPHQISEALEYLKNESRKKELIDLGLQRAREFTWSEASKKTLAIYRSLISKRKTA